MARRAENIDDAEEQQAQIRELLRPLENAAHLVIWDMMGAVETAKPGDLRFRVPSRELPYDGQMLLYEREKFLILYLFPRIDIGEIEPAVLFEFVSRLNAAILIGAFEYSPDKPHGLVFRNSRTLAKREREESEVRAVQSVLNTSDFALTVFEKSWKYFSNFGMSVSEAIWAASL